MTTIGINDFVRRQLKNTGKTYSLLSFEEIAKYAEIQVNKNLYKKGYRDGVILVEVENNLIHNFICPFVKITDKTILKSEIKKRREEEEGYIRIKALNGETLKTGTVELILYRHDVLNATNENTSNSDWEFNSARTLIQPSSQRTSFVG